jgi:hypothetical protein
MTETDDLRETMRLRCEEIERKIAARDGKPGYTANVEALKVTLSELRRLLGDV